MQKKKRKFMTKNMKRGGPIKSASLYFLLLITESPGVGGGSEGCVGGSAGRKSGLQTPFFYYLPYVTIDVQLIFVC
jgi:hypothetical protein